MIDDSSSSKGLASFAILTGANSPGAEVVASFRFGDNRANAEGMHEFAIADGEPFAAGLSPGHLTWDPGYIGPDSSLFSVAAVRLEVWPGRSRWSVGTNDFVQCQCRPFRHIIRIQLLAQVQGGTAERLVQWDMIDVTLFRSDGTDEKYMSPCLPRVTSSQKFRRSAAQSELSKPSVIQQYVEITVNGDDVVRLLIRGQVTLRAAIDGQATAGLGPDDLRGAIHVFTDAGLPVDGI